MIRQYSIEMDERRRNVLREKRGGIEAYREGEVRRLEGEIQREGFMEAAENTRDMSILPDFCILAGEYKAGISSYFTWPPLQTIRSLKKKKSNGWGYLFTILDSY